MSRDKGVPSKDEVMSADAKGLKAICARLGIKPKGKVDAIREAILDELEARSRPKQPVDWDELEALSDAQVVEALESLGFKTRGKKSKLREALAKHLGIEKPPAAKPAKAQGKEEAPAKEPGKGKAKPREETPARREDEPAGGPKEWKPEGRGAGGEKPAGREVPPKGAEVETPPQVGAEQAEGAKAKPPESASWASALAMLQKGEGKPQTPKKEAEVSKAKDAEASPPPSALSIKAKEASPTPGGPELSHSFSKELHIGIMLNGIGKHKEAIEYLKKAMEGAKSQHEESLCNLHMGVAHFALGRRFEATPFFDEVEEIAGLKAVATENRAMAAAAEGDLQQAVQILEEVLAKDPSLQRVWFRRGEVLLKMGKPGAALQSFDKMDKGSDGGGYLLKGHAFLLMGQRQKAREQCNEALRVSGTNRRAWLSKASLAIADGDVKEAELAVGKALALDKEDASAWVCKAALLHLQGRNAEALDALNTVDPKGRIPALRNARAFIMVRLDRIDEARRLAERPISDADPEAHNILGIILARDGDEEGARARFKRSLELDPDFADAAANLKRIEEGAPAASKQLRQQALQAKLEQEILPAVESSAGADCPRCESKGTFANGECTLCGYGGTGLPHGQAKGAGRVSETEGPGRCPQCGFFVGEGAKSCPACEAEFGGSNLSTGEKEVLELLSSIDGMDAEKAGQVIRHNYRSKAALSKATVQELVSIPGISVTLAKRIMEAVK